MKLIDPRDKVKGRSRLFCLSVDRQMTSERLRAPMRRSGTPLKRQGTRIKPTTKAVVVRHVRAYGRMNYYLVHT